MTKPIINQEMPITDRFLLIKQFLRIENLSIQQMRILEELEILFRQTTFTSTKQQMHYYQSLLRLIESLDMFSPKQGNQEI